jgi:NADH dehydrogenase/NADH:ubiquinone oxidoreductase subunit G
MGALTLKQYSYVGRPWELKSRKAVDVLDSMLSSLRVDYLGEDLKRILHGIL